MGATSWAALRQTAKEAGIGGEPIPAGTYEAEVDSAEYKQASTGSDMLVLKFRITEPGPQQNRRQYTNIVLKPDSAGSVSFFFQHMEALGLGDDYFAGEPAWDQIADDLVGRAASITIKKGKPYRGKEKAEVDRIEPPAGAPAAAPAAEAPASNIPKPSF